MVRRLIRNHKEGLISVSIRRSLLLFSVSVPFTSFGESGYGAGFCTHFRTHFSILPHRRPVNHTASSRAPGTGDGRGDQADELSDFPTGTRPRGSAPGTEGTGDGRGG